LANHLKSKRANSALSRQNTSKAINQFEALRFQDYCDDHIRTTTGNYDYVPGLNSPYDAGINISSPAILDTGANNTYVNDRRLISNLTSATALVEVADGSHHPILGSGTLVNHPSIPAHFVPSFKNNLLGISPIINSGAVGIITSDKMTLVKSSPLVDKILNFILQYSNDNNLIILTGNKSNDLYITNLNPPIASLSVDSRHFPSIKELVYYFYIVFNCPSVDTYCHLLSIPTVSGFPPHLTAKNVRKHYPYNDKIRSQSQQSKKPVHPSTNSSQQRTFCGEIVELDILIISTPTTKLPTSYGGFKHVLLAVDSFSSYVSYIPIKSMTKPQRFISALITKYQNAGHPIKHLKMDNQFHTPDILSYLDSINITYTFAPPYEHEFIGKIERMNRTIQDKLTCALQISIIKSKKMVICPL